MGEIVTHALTLWRPWPWAIFHGGKNVENRSWAPPPLFIGKRIAIHAGKKWDEDSLYDIASIVKRGRPGEPALPGKQMREEGIIGTARIVGVVRDNDDLFKPPTLVAGTWGKIDPATVRQWFCGPYGWLLDEARPLLSPAMCKGAQGLWALPYPIEVA